MDVIEKIAGIIDMSPVIRSVDDEQLKGALKRKKEEYELRLHKLALEHPYRPIESRFFAELNYRIALLEGLLERGEVRTWDVSRALKKKFASFYSDIFDNSCCIGT